MTGHDPDREHRHQRVNERQQQAPVIGRRAPTLNRRRLRPVGGGRVAHKPVETIERAGQKTGVDDFERAAPDQARAQFSELTPPARALRFPGALQHEIEIDREQRQDRKRGGNRPAQADRHIRLQRRSHQSDARGGGETSGNPNPDRMPPFGRTRGRFVASDRALHARRRPRGEVFRDACAKLRLIRHAEQIATRKLLGDLRHLAILEPEHEQKTRRRQRLLQRHVEFEFGVRGSEIIGREDARAMLCLTEPLAHPLDERLARADLVLINARPMPERRKRVAEPMREPTVPRVVTNKNFRHNRPWPGSA